MKVEIFEYHPDLEDLVAFNENINRWLEVNARRVNVVEHIKQSIAVLPNETVPYIVISIWYSEKE